MEFGAQHANKPCVIQSRVYRSYVFFIGSSASFVVASKGQRASIERTWEPTAWRAQGSIESRVDVKSPPRRPPLTGSLPEARLASRPPNRCRGGLKEDRNGSGTQAPSQLVSNPGTKRTEIVVLSMHLSEGNRGVGRVGGNGAPSP